MTVEAGNSREMERVPQIPAPQSWQSQGKKLAKRLLLPLTLILRRRVIARYLALESQPKLHVGCGRHLLEGWLNTDLSSLNRRKIVYLDARQKLPFRDNQFHFIFNEHFISTVTLEEAARFVAECYRVLKPGGVLRTATAGLPFLLELLESRDPRCRDYVRWAADEFLGVPDYSPCLVINNLFYGFGCKFIYDPETLTSMLYRARFSRVVPAKVGESSHPELRGLEGHGKCIPSEFNELETFILEASKE
ncbi:MAG: methyltransferase domain-containing protein [Acidobacteriia bacterium]|nr:methyltransferase domain-containing protein [Terriglobia bacterium]